MENQELRFDNLRQVLKDYGEALVEAYKNNLTNYDHNASRDLYNSVRYIASFGANKYEISLNLAEYWKYLEYDTRPHFPPVDAILEWIRIKPVLPHPDDNGNLPTEKQLAFLIGRKISEEGTKGKNMLQKSVADVNTEYFEKIYDAIDKDIDTYSIVMLNNFTRSW